MSETCSLRRLNAPLFVSVNVDAGAWLDVGAVRMSGMCCQRAGMAWVPGRSTQAAMENFATLRACWKVKYTQTLDHGHYPMSRLTTPS